MNVGEKVCLYRVKLKHKNFAEFARKANCSVSWLNDLSKKDKIKQINDMENLTNLCEYLGITIDEFLKDENANNYDELDINDTTDVEDIGVLINRIIVLLEREDVKMNNVLMNEKSREVCADAINVVQTLVRQHL